MVARARRDSVMQAARIDVEFREQRVPTRFAPELDPRLPRRRLRVGALSNGSSSE
jgi:hypothetical protein